MESFFKACGQVRAAAGIELLTLITAGARGGKEMVEGVAENLLSVTEGSE